MSSRSTNHANSNATRQVCLNSTFFIWEFYFVPISHPIINQFFHPQMTCIFVFLSHAGGLFIGTYMKIFDDVNYRAVVHTYTLSSDASAFFLALKMPPEAAGNTRRFSSDESLAGRLAVKSSHILLVVLRGVSCSFLISWWVWWFQTHFYYHSYLQ